jgi:hypothetical protein
LKAQIKSAIEGNSKAKFKLANRKPFKDGALALSSPPKSKPSKKSSSSKRGGSIDAMPSPKARAAVLYVARTFGDGVALI